jgi:hypothetical protein
LLLLRAAGQVPRRRACRAYTCRSVFSFPGKYASSLSFCIIVFPSFLSVCRATGGTRRSQRATGRRPPIRICGLLDYPSWRTSSLTAL